MPAGNIRVLLHIGEQDGWGVFGAKEGEGVVLSAKTAG